MPIVAIAFNLLVLLLEIVTPHPTEDSKRTVKMITKGRYARTFYWGTLFLGNLLPLGLLLTGLSSPLVPLVAGLSTIIGIYLTEHIWVEAPQRIPLS